MAKMRISPELKKLIEKYRCVKDTEGMSPAKVYKLVGENENLYLKMTDSRYKGTTYDVEREKDMMLSERNLAPILTLLVASWRGPTVTIKNKEREQCPLEM